MMRFYGDGGSGDELLRADRGPFVGEPSCEIYRRSARARILVDVRRTSDAQHSPASVGAATTYAVLVAFGVIPLIMNWWPSPGLTRGRPPKPGVQQFYGCEDFATCIDLVPDYKWDKDRPPYCRTHRKVIDVPCYYL
jgi:hypothetical protein